MMKRVGVVVSLCLALAACDPPLPGLKREPVAAKPAPAKPAPAKPREPVAVPIEDRPVMGKQGDTKCVTSDNEYLLGQDKLICLSLLKDTIKTDTAADSASLKLARLRLVFFQPGPMVDGKFVGWGLFAIRTHCGTKEINVMGNVIYTPEGVEISRATPVGGRLELPQGFTADKFLKQVCK